jgi:hypothetical protein
MRCCNVIRRIRLSSVATSFLSNIFMSPSRDTLSGIFTSLQRAHRRSRRQIEKAAEC